LNRKHLIAGSVAAILLLLVLIVAGVKLWQSMQEPPHAGQKIFVAQLGYCGAEDTGPCIVSFSQDGAGNMLVDILIPSASFPDFYLIISLEGERYQYECENVEDIPTRVHCIGREMFPGELLQFTLFSVEEERVIAEGQFTLIGLLLSTSVAGASESTPSPNGFSTPVFLEGFTPVVRTPTPTATLSSYPNPSYPNSSYPNP
jgi:hypothetical protein